MQRLYTISLQFNILFYFIQRFREEMHIYVEEVIKAGIMIDLAVKYARDTGSKKVGTVGFSMGGL